MGEVVFKSEFEVDANGGLAHAGEGDFAGGRIAGDDLGEGGLVETEVWFCLGEWMGGHKERATRAGIAPATTHYQPCGVSVRSGALA